MARLPTAIPTEAPDLGVVQPDASRAIPSYTPGQVGEAMQVAARQIGQSADELQDTQDRLAAAQGVSAFLTKKLQLDQAAETDQDYATLPDRYSAQLQLAAQQASSGITSPVRRAEFQTQLKSMMNYAQGNVMRTAHAKAVDADRGWIQQLYDQNIDTALKAPDENTRMAIFGATQSAIDAMASKGSITQKEAEGMRRKLPHDFAERYALTLQPDDRIAFLQGQPIEGAPGHALPDTTFDNNVGNLKVSAADWEGKGAPGGPGNAFETFLTPAHGARAATLNLLAQADRIQSQTGQPATLQQAISVWAPKTDGNDPLAYAKRVSQETGIGVNDPLPTSDPQAMTKLIASMAGVEKGKPISGDAIQAGVSSALTGTPLRTPVSKPLTGGAGTLADFIDPDKKQQLLANAVTQSHALMERDISYQRYLDEQGQRRLRDTQTANFSTTFADVLKGGNADPVKLADMVRTQQITPEQSKAIVAEQARQGRGEDNIGVLTDLQHRADTAGAMTQQDYEGTSSDVYSAIERGDLKGSTGARLIHTMDAKRTQQDNQVERGLFSTMKTLLGGDAVEKGMLDFGNAAHVAQIQKWGMAQAEWNQRVLINKEDPTAVFSDVLPRYMPPITDARALPRPRMGAVNSIEDVGRVWQASKAAKDAGTITQDQLDTEADLLNRYRDIFQKQAERKALLDASKPQTDAGKAKVRGLVPQEDNQ